MSENASLENVIKNLEKYLAMKVKNIWGNVLCTWLSVLSASFLLVKDILSPRIFFPLQIERKQSWFGYINWFGFSSIWQDHSKDDALFDSETLLRDLLYGVAEDSPKIHLMISVSFFDDLFFPIPVFAWIFFPPPPFYSELRGSTTTTRSQ